MKIRIINLIAITVLILVANSCDKNDGTVEEEVTSADVMAIKTIVMSGEWQISHYFDSENDLTTDYADFTFNFNENGTIATTDGNSALSGAWLVKSESDDDETAEVNFDIHFSSPNLFKKLTEDWQIKKYTDSKIELMYVNSEDDSTLLLTFQK